MSKYKAVNAFIFAGSFSIGVMEAGFDLKKVLEISDEMPKQNAFYFIKNYPNIPVIVPSEWENDDYLEKLKKEKVDLMCCNCPCSSLSRINIHASVDGKNNIHFYRLFNIFKKAQPKVFVVENAPTLIKLGFPILRDMVNELKDIYRFTIIRDYAGNHNVPMKRMRTMVVGWRKDAFKETPILNVEKTKMPTVKDTLKDIMDDPTDDACPAYIKHIKSLFKYSLPHCGIDHSLARALMKNDSVITEEIKNTCSETYYKHLLRIKTKIENGRGFWDKSAKRMPLDAQFPSMSGPQQYMHPVQNRTLNMRELKRIMGYPESFDFTDPNKECQTPYNVAMAQGVPVNFGKWVAGQVKNGLDGKLSTVKDDIVFQNNISELYETFSVDDFNNLTELNPSFNGEKLKA